MWQNNFKRLISALILLFPQIASRRGKIEPLINFMITEQEKGKGKKTKSLPRGVKAKLWQTINNEKCWIK